MPRTFRVRARARDMVCVRVRDMVCVRAASDLARGISADAFGRLRKVFPLCPPSPM